MPIYEFACDKCRKVYQFFFRSPSAKKKPRCPSCGNRGLRRHMSRFAVKSGGAGEPASADEPDPARMEQALGRLERDMGSLDENDPRQMGHFMRRMMEETGTDLGPEMETAIRRLESGEDPEKIEEEMGDLLGDDVGSGDGSDYGYDDNLYEA